MAKIFIGFFNGIREAKDPYAMPIFYEAFIKGLKENGNKVFAVMHPTWNAQFGEVPEKLLAEIKTFNPDLIFLFNNSFYDLSKHFDCPIVIYEVDSPLYYNNQEILKAKPERFQYFVSASTSEEILINDFKVPKKNILQVPFFTAVQAENIEKKHNICFIGTKFRNSYKHCFNNFMETNPTDEEREEFKNLMLKLQDNVFISKEELFKNTTSQKILSTFKPYDVTFMLSDYRRIDVLSAIADLGINIWGTPNWASDFYNEPWLILNFHKKAVYTIKHNQDIYNSSKIGINIGHLQAKNGFPWRVFDIMASNACLVTEYHGDFSRYIPNLKLPYFSNTWEAREICKKLIENENYRLDIVAQSQEFVNKNYRFINTLKIIENHLNMSLSKQLERVCGVCSRIARLDEWLDKPIETNSCTASKPKLNFKNKMCYKIWSHYNKILKKKGIIK